MRGVSGTAAGPVVVERADGVGGELVLRRDGADYEIISNGVFLMDTRNGESERLLVRAAVEAVVDPSADPVVGGMVDGAGGVVRVLIGGLGVGFSLAEALTLPRVGRVTVVEREPAVVGWHRTVLRPWSRGAVDDPRVTVETADLLDVLARPGAERYDAVCLDIDNGPGWTVTPGNARLYDPPGLDLAAARLTPGGVLAVWSANAAPEFETLLRRRFGWVEVRAVPVARGEPDVVYLAREPDPRR